MVVNPFDSLESGKGLAVRIVKFGRMRKVYPMISSSFRFPAEVGNRLLEMEPLMEMTVSRIVHGRFEVGRLLVCFERASEVDGLWTFPRIVLKFVADDRIQLCNWRALHEDRTYQTLVLDGHHWLVMETVGGSSMRIMVVKRSQEEEQQDSECRLAFWEVSGNLNVSSSMPPSPSVMMYMLLLFTITFVLINLQVNRLISSVTFFLGSSVLCVA